jgi:hypothetical protein
MTHSGNGRRKRIFVAMPFQDQHDPIYSVVRDAASLLGADIVRLDEESFAGSIISKIRSEIEGADLVTAIVSEENGNVYYEIGLAHCQKKPVVLLTSDPSSLKFDLRDHRAIVYDPYAPSGIRDELVRTLNSVINPPSDPEALLASAFKGTDACGHAVHHAMHKVVQTLALEHNLEPPVRLTKKELVPEKRTVSIEVQDFMKTTIRAVIDVNGIVQKSTVIH